MLNKIISFFFKHKAVAPVALSYEDQLLADAEARKIKYEAAASAAKKAALIKQLNQEAAQFDTYNLALKVVEDLADAEELAEAADADYAEYLDVMTDVKASVAKLRAARQAKDKKTN